MIILKNDNQWFDTIISGYLPLIFSNAILPVFLIVMTLIFFIPTMIHAEELLSIHAGMGDIQIKAKNEQFLSDAKNTQKHVAFGIELEKELSMILKV